MSKPMRRISHVGACLLAAAAAAATAGEPVSAPYTAFDSRLTARPLVRHDLRRGLLAFVPLGRGAAFLYPGRVIVEMRDEATSLSVPRATADLLYLADGVLWLSGNGRLLPLEDDGPDPSRALPVPLGARLRASGTTSFVQARTQEGRTRFDVRTRSGETSGLALIPGELRAFDWSSNGFAAVVGSAVYGASLGSRDLIELDRHPGYARATDVVALPAGRVLVTVGHTVWLLGRGCRSVVVGMPAKLALAGEAVFFLDRASGVVWAAKGFDRMGPRAGDLAYAQRLQGEARQECRALSPCPKAAEASRLLGRGTR